MDNTTSAPARLDRRPESTPSVSARARPRYVSLWRAVPGSLLFLIPTLPIVMVGLVLTSVAASLGIGLAILGVGIIILVGALWTGRGFAELERMRLRTTGLPSIPAPDWCTPEEGTPRLRMFLSPLAGGRWWLALLHTMIVNPVVGTVTWSLTLVWLVTAASGASYWYWSQFLPDHGQSWLLPAGIRRSLLPDSLLQSDLTAVVNIACLVVGIIFLITLPLIIRGLVVIHHRIAASMIGASPQDALRAELVATSRARGAAVAAEASAVQRLERDIHDGPQQRLIRLQMDLSAAERRLTVDPEAALSLIGEARAQAADALDELRALSRGLMPPLLQDRGLVAAIEALATGSTVPTTTSLAVIETVQMRAEVERGVYFVVAELLTNIAKHSGAHRASIDAELQADRQGGMLLLIRVADDGHGGAHLVPAHGLAGLTERAQGLEGTLTIEQPLHWDGIVRGTSITVAIPVR